MHHGPMRSLLNKTSVFLVAGLHFLNSQQCQAQKDLSDGSAHLSVKSLEPTDSTAQDFSFYGLVSREAGDLAPGAVGAQIDGVADVRGPAESAATRGSLVLENLTNEVTPFLATLIESSKSTQDSSSRAVLGNDDRKQITNTKVVPYRTICKLSITFKDGHQTGGTGFLVSRRTVLTAGHCVYQSDHKGWASKIVVTPGLNGSTKPYGSVSVGSSALVSNTAWTNGTDDDKDYGAIVLPDSTLGNKTGTFGYEVFRGVVSPTTFYVGGYPADKPKGTVWYASGQVKFVDADKILHTVDTEGGESGAPMWLIRNNVRYAIGIHVAGVSDTRNQATKINQSVYDFIQRRP